MYKYIIGVYLLLISCFFSSCNVKKENTNFFKLKDKLSVNTLSTYQKYLTSSGSFEDMYTISKGGYTFDVMVNEKGNITFFKTEDLNFTTPSGIKIGTSLKEINRESSHNIKNMMGWGYYILLSDGWFAGLENEKNIVVNQKLSLDSKVELLFKSVYH